MSENNKVILEHEKYSINNFSIYNGDQKINFNGVLSTDPDENLFISIVNFDFENLNPLMTKKLNGVLNGFIDVKDFFRERKIDSRLNLRDFKINDFLVGNVIAYSEYDNTLRNFDVNLDVITNGKQTMLISGKFDPGDATNQLDLEANFTSANINLIQPFYEDIISDVSGQLDGKVAIKGRLKNLVIDGRGKTNGGEFTLDYLKTHYKLDGEVVFDEHNIQFVDFKLQDHHNNEGTISGVISHNAFKELSYDFSGSMKNFLVLNTTPKDNNLYYGTAYATGNLRIFGKEKVLNISATATTAPGTRFYIPLDGGGEVIKEDFINFISIQDTVALQKRTESKKVNLAGINLNFDFDITRDAYCEIIFDVTAGDIIRGRGNGKINLQIDTKGDFNMYGDYMIEEGWYNFTLYNVINKEFQIEPSSKISWIGDPYEAILDIKANYEQLASLTPILRATQDDINLNPELSRKYPAKVLLGIKGSLIAPEIEFGIDIDEYPKNAIYRNVSYETHLTAFKNKLATDEQELKRQVFSLIILKNFSSENAFNVGGSVEKSVSEFISNQISYWVTQFDENLIIDVDLGSLDEEAFNTFQLRMSYSFLDGRLRVTRDGGFSDAATGTNVASVLGDWSVEYLLTNDGRLRAKIYNRTNYNTLNPEVRSASTTAGFSILHTTSFDKLKEVFKKARDQNRPPATNEPAPPSESTEPVSKQ
ncbi:MAG: translocation/assembly module TamB domain-containing protein [Cyclobacteriaceae bacterium]|nr:translocation/assembly module TamB domain-containing protein [Cyclobacteriaceae bacterium]